MQAQSRMADFTAEIDTLYVALKRTGHGALDIAHAVNDILLQKGVSKDILAMAWDDWFARHQKPHRGDNL